ncbi:hypothetical protein ATO6_00300 [Oceanicola sp. 22II-s10i]|nr:hypothetical protein ATO6_00300 [Oceanicola sp. 22II-s10i]
MDLTGKLLIAMPGMMDSRFTSAVVFLCAHSDEGAMGLMVNRPSAGVRLCDLFEQLNIECESGAGEQHVLSGGPVEEERGFVLHSPDYTSAISTLKVTQELSMTATMDVMEDIAADRGPARTLVTLGYCGWGAGQLESELAMNAWLTAEASAGLIFDTAISGRWEAALRTLGISPALLSSAAGRA